MIAVQARFRSAQPHEYNEINGGPGLPAGTQVTPEALAGLGLLSRPELPVVILGRGEVKVPLTIRVQRISKGARAKIEAAGGTVEEFSAA
jgi:large subunit ribosomal protein L15